MNRYSAAIKILATTLLLVATGIFPVNGQDPYGMYGDGMYDDYYDQDGIPIADSAPPKVRKPLESYFFDDSVRNQNMFVWHVDTYRNKIELTRIDTTISSLQKDYPYIQKGVGDAIQGNMGGASIPLNYYDRPHYHNYQFAEPYNAFLFFPENTLFFNVKKPYTNFAYYTAGQTRRREEGFGITHAQNISPSSGFNIDYKSRGTRGYYDWGKGRAKNLSMAFNHTGKKYSIHAGYIYNTINNKENGGIVDMRFITDSIFELPQNIPVSLTDARNIIKNNTYYLVQSYGIPLRRLTDEDFSIADRSSIFFGHSLTYNRWARNYTDTRSATEQNVTDAAGNTTRYEYYDNWYFNSAFTADSTFETLLSNRVFVQIQPFDRNGIVGLIDAGVGADVHYYYQFNPMQYLTGNTAGVYKTDYYLYGSVEGKFRQYLDWGADAAIYPAGYRSGDFSVGAHASISAFIREKPVTLTGRFSNELRSPSFWMGRYYSNHYVWSNSFSKENELRFNVSLSMPWAAFELGMSQSVITDMIYRNALRMPTQQSGSVSVTGVYADKDFRFAGVHLRHRVLLQWSTNEEVVPVPLASAYLSYYYEFNVVKNVLRAQVGFDARYHTKYYAFGWDPSQAAFFNQRETKIGNYPFVDFYVAGKWKRMRLLLKMEHVNENLFGSRNYFMLLDYPVVKRVFKFGFSWAFYD